MDTSRRRGLAGGLILIFLGAAFLAAQFAPGFRAWFRGENSWPLIIIGIGVVFLALAPRTPPLAVPGCIVAGIGCMLFYQNATGNWGSWAYAWTLIPGFVGLGVVLSGLLEGQAVRSLIPGLWLIVISAVAFLLFGSFLGLGRLTPYWPVLLVLAGLLVMGQAILGRRH